MTRPPKSSPSLAAAPSKAQRWGLILAVAVELAEQDESLQQAVTDRDLAVLRSALTARVSRPDDATIMAACAWVIRARWLFTPQLRPACRHASAVMARLDPRRIRVGLALLAALATSLVAFHFVQSHSYARWQKVVAPLAGDAALVQQKAAATIRLATDVGIVPLGASAHAEGALMEINKLNRAMHGLIVTSTEPDVLQSAFAEHPDAQQVLAHDRSVLGVARQHLQLANEEVDRAEKVLAYGKKWNGLDPYAVLPAGLSSQWSSEAIIMRSALNSGDLQKMAQADTRLETLQEGGELARNAATVVSGLSAEDQLLAAPHLAVILDAVTRGELTRATSSLAVLTKMKKQAPLSYSLYLLPIPGEKTFVVKQDARDSSVTRHYLIVQATDVRGAQVPIDIHDSELDKDVVASRFGVEVSAGTFEQAQTAEREGLLLVGKKSPGTAATAFALPVLDGRISRW